MCLLWVLRLCCAVLLPQASHPEVQEEVYQELVAAGIAPAGEGSMHLQWWMFKATLCQKAGFRVAMICPWCALAQATTTQPTADSMAQAFL